MMEIKTRNRLIIFFVILGFCMIGGIIKGAEEGCNKQGTVKPPEPIITSEYQAIDAVKGEMPPFIGYNIPNDQETIGSYVKGFELMECAIKYGVKDGEIEYREGTWRAHSFPAFEGDWIVEYSSPAGGLKLAFRVEPDGYVYPADDFTADIFWYSD